MPAPTLRADYDQLKRVASAFRGNVEAAQCTLQSIRSKKETLEGGDWVGQAATAFFHERDGSILPTLQRLIKALDTAANGTSQISSIMKDAEDQAANVLKGPGGSSGPIGASSAAAGSGLGGTIGGVAGAGPAGPVGAASTGGKEYFTVKGAAGPAGPVSAARTGGKEYFTVKDSRGAGPANPNIITTRLAANLARL